MVCARQHEPARFECVGDAEVDFAEGNGTESYNSQDESEREMWL